MPDRPSTFGAHAERPDVDGLAWRLLQNSSVHRCNTRTELAAVGAALAAEGYRQLLVDADRWGDTAEMHTDLAAALGASAGYGFNLDALADLLRDRAETQFAAGPPPVSGTLLTVAGFGGFAERSPGNARGLLEAFAGAARYGLLVGHLMLCVVQSERQESAVGATPVAAVDPRWLRRS
jgi:hypothetical protein